MRHIHSLRLYISMYVRVVQCFRCQFQIANAVNQSLLTNSMCTSSSNRTQKSANLRRIKIKIISQFSFLYFPSQFLILFSLRILSEWRLFVSSLMYFKTNERQNMVSLDVARNGEDGSGNTSSCNIVDFLTYISFSQFIFISHFCCQNLAIDRSWCLTLCVLPQRWMRHANWLFCEKVQRFVYVPWENYLALNLTDLNFGL
jgi:hypothetical protein